MHIYELSELAPELLASFQDESVGDNVFTKLRSSQTGNHRHVDQSRIAYLLDSPEHIMLLAVEDDQLLGMVVGQRVVGIGNEYFYINDIVVDPNSQGKGIGSLLMESLQEKALLRFPNVVRFQLTSRPSRGTASFFMKFGYRARTAESGDETTVYVKDLGSYHS